jgi:hypothetical protein
MKRRLPALIIVLASIIGLGAIMVNRETPREVISTQTPPRVTVPVLPPTVPCPFCGPSGQLGNGTTAWAYPLHFCLSVNAPDATFALIYGVGRLVTQPITFFASIQQFGTRQLDTLNPGDETAEFFFPPNPLALTVAPGETFLLHVWATTDGTETGPRFLFGNGSTERVLTLVCECPTQQTVPPPPPPPVTTVATTVPGATTTIPRVATSKAQTTTTTVPFTLVPVR